MHSLAHGVARTRRPSFRRTRFSVIVETRNGKKVWSRYLCERKKSLFRRIPWPFVYTHLLLVLAGSPCPDRITFPSLLSSSEGGFFSSAVSFPSAFVVWRGHFERDQRRVRHRLNLLLMLCLGRTLSSDFESERTADFQGKSETRRFSGTC